MTKNSFYSRFPDKNAAWAMSLNARESDAVSVSKLLILAIAELF